MNARRTRNLTPALALLACAGLARADEIIVPTEMPLSVALATALNGDTITLLPSGSPYQQFPGLTLSNKRLTIRGSTGNPADVVIDGADLDRVLSISGATADGTIIDGITIQNGRNPSAVAESSGAGLVINGARVTVQNCVIRSNRVPASEGNGAGLYATASAVTIRNTRFESNTTGLDGDGAAVYFNTSDGQTSVLEDCVFLNNTAEATLSNEASGGGAIWVDNGTFRFTRCTFAGNQGEQGGAVYVTTAAAATFEACKFDANTARNGGAIMISAGATSGVIRNCLFVNNHCLVAGKAIRTDKATDIINCTLTGQHADGNFTISSSLADMRVINADNCIFWNNGAGNIVPSLGTPSAILRRCIVPLTYNIANGSGFNTVIDPLFVNAAAGNYHLQPTSPAIDAGDTDLYFGPLADYDVLTRGVDIPTVANTGTSTFGPVIDIGAYEMQVSIGLACYANCDGSTANPVLTANDFQCFINAFAGGCP